MPNRPEDDFILDFIPILRKYLTARNLDILNDQLDILEQGLRAVAESQTLAKDATDLDSNASDGDAGDGEAGDGDSGGSNSGENSEAESSNKAFDITFYDLKEDVQSFIVESYGCKSVAELIKRHPNLDGPIFTLEL